MTNNGVPRLCGGTFFTQLLLSRKPTVSQRQRTQGETDVFHNEDVLFALIQIIQPDAIKPTGTSFETYTTNFKKCDGSIGEDLKFENENVRSAFLKRLTDEYPTVLNAVAALCADYIDTRETPREHEKLVKRLIELIRDDSSIDDSKMFRVGNNALSLNKKALPKATEINLADFLLSILEFIVTERSDNSIGRDTILAWHSVPNVKGRYNGIDGSSIMQDIVVTFDYSDFTKESHDSDTFDDCNATAEDEPHIFEETAEQPTSTTQQVIVNGNVFNAKNQFFGNVENVFDS